MDEGLFFLYQRFQGGKQQIVDASLEWFAQTIVDNNTDSALMLLVASKVIGLQSSSLYPGDELGHANGRMCAKSDQHIHLPLLRSRNVKEHFVAGKRSSASSMSRDASSRPTS